MKQWIRKLTSAFLASLLTVSLHGQVSAESEEVPALEPPLPISDPSASTDAPAETGEAAAPEAAPVEANEAPAVSAEAVTETGDAPTVSVEAAAETDDAPAMSEEVAAETDEAPAVSEEAAAETDDAPAVSAEAVAETDDANVETPRINTDEAVTAAAGDESSVTQTPAATITQLEDGRYVLVNHAGTENLRADGDITILAAGLNRISSISGTGKVSIAGTGILLVDSLEGELDLLTLTDVYDKGSTAVFVKQTDGSYLLVNGVIPGILDEEYSISDASLVVPDQSSLLLCGTGAEPILDKDRNITEVHYYHGTEHGYRPSVSANVIEQVGKLTITGAASLVIRRGAALLMENLKSLGFTRTDEFMRYPELAVTNGGTLTVEGDVTGRGFVSVDGNGSSLSGSGSVTARQIEVEDPDAISSTDLTLSAGDIYLNGDGTYQGLTIDNSSVHMENGSASISGLHISGNCTILLFGGTNVDLSSVDGTLSLRRWHDPVSVISGDMEGNGTIRFEVGTFLLEKGIKMNDVSISTEPGGQVFDYAGILETCLPLMHIRPEDMTRADQSEDQSIPVAAARMIDHGEKNKLSCMEVIQLAENMSIRVSRDENQKLVLSPEDLQGMIDVYKTSLGWDNTEGTVEIQFLRLNNGTLSLDTCEESKLTPVSAEDVCLVRILLLEATSFVEPVGIATQTGTVFTGSGLLGGSGAGSVRYGSVGHSDPRGNDDTNGTGNGDAGKRKTGTAPQTAAVWVVAQSDGIHYMLCALDGEKTLRDFGGRVSVSMRYELPPQDAGKALYAVFRNADGTITAARARYSGMNGELSFETDRLGAFVIVAFDFDGEEFSDAFYAALEDLLVRQHLN